MDAKALVETFHNKVAYASKQGISINAGAPLAIPALEARTIQGYYLVEVDCKEEFAIIRLFPFAQDLSGKPRKAGFNVLAVKHFYEPVPPNEPHIRLEPGDIFQVVPEDWEYDFNGPLITFQATAVTFIVDQKITAEDYLGLTEKYPTLKELKPKIVCNPNGYYSTLFGDLRQEFESHIKGPKDE